VYHRRDDPAIGAARSRLARAIRQELGARAILRLGQTGPFFFLATTCWRWTLADLSSIASLPNVKCGVVSDRNGGLLDAFRESDPDSVSSVTGFIANALGPVGEELGLGGLTRISFAGQARAWLVVVLAEAFLSIAIEPPTAFSTVERAIDSGGKR
jgi:hypothetical protein